MKRPQAAALAITAAVAALGAFAYVRAADEPSGYVGKGQVVVQTTIAGSDKLTVGGDIAMEELGSRLRIDLLSLGFPGTSATISSLVGTQLFPPGGFTVVYDRKNSSYTVWSNAKQRYYTNAAAAGPAPNLPPGPLSVAVVAGGDLFGAFSFARSLKDDSAFTLSVGLAGHQTVNGHPASGLNFQYARTTNAGDTVDLHGTFQFADDLAGLPVEITAAGHSRSIPESALRIDFSSVAQQTPPEGDFEPPAGYVRVDSLGDVIGRTLPGL